MTLYTVTMILFCVMTVLAAAWENYIVVTIGIGLIFSISPIQFAQIGALVVANPILVFVCVVSYLVVGIIWSFFKWYQLCKKEFNKVRDREDEEKAFVARRAALEDPVPSHQLAFGTPANREHEYRREKPNVKYHLDKISGWIGYWPFSLFWTFIQDWVIDLFQSLAKLFKKRYQQIADNIFTNP